MILLLETLHGEAMALLKDHAPIVCLEAADEALAFATEQPVTAILTRGKGRITSALMDACGSTLRAVSRVGAGVDTVDVPAAHQRGIAVVYAPGINAATTAEQTLMLLLALTRRVCPLNAQVRAGNWLARDRYEGFELRGRTLGIVGMGAIGQQVARRARAFDMLVQFSNRSERFVDGCRQVPLDHLLATSDIVSLHTPLNEQTRGLIGSAQLGLMKTGAYLINTARGAVVDKAALAVSLESGHLAGYAADVFDPQPPAAQDLLLMARDNVLITPHVAGLTDKTYRDVCLFCARNLLAVLRGESPDERSICKHK